MRCTEDLRGNSFWDVFAGTNMEGQINISITKPKQRRGFHLHKKKTDHWFCLEGKLLVFLLDTELKMLAKHIMAKGDYLMIEPNIWHAYQNIDAEDSTLIYYETNKSGSDRSDDFEISLDTIKEWQ